MPEAPSMPTRSTSGLSNASESAFSQAQPGGINDELVRLIADRVYQQLLQELQYEHERLRLVSKWALTSRFRKGGR